MTEQTGTKPAETDEQGMARQRRYAASLRLPAAQCSRSTDLACGYGIKLWAGAGGLCLTTDHSAPLNHRPAIRS